MASSIEIRSARQASKAVETYSVGSYSASSSSSTSNLALAPESNPFQSRRPSLLSTAFAKQECTVIDIGEPDGPPRLISYLSSSQGFAWNPELFLPSYVDYDYVPLENRREPVHEIHLTEEDLRIILPQ